MIGLRRHPEVHLFVLWSEARTIEQRILADIAAHFTVLDAVDVVWSTGVTFARNLSRMYGDTLPPGSNKELHCGSGPLLAVVVEDLRPRYRVRRHRRKVKYLNSRVFDARARYRSWTGGGHRVHASETVAEAERNLVFLFGERSADFRRRGPRGDVPRRHEDDPVGTIGWRSMDELVLALEVHGGEVVGRPAAEQVTVRTTDVWWAERIAGGRVVEPGTREVLVAGRPVRVSLIPAPARRRSVLSAVGQWRTAGSAAP